MNITMSANHEITLPHSTRLLEGKYFITATALTNDSAIYSFDATFNVTACAVGQIKDQSGTCVDAPLLGTLRPQLTSGAPLVLYTSVSFNYVQDPSISGFKFDGVGISSLGVKGVYGVNDITAPLTINSTFVGANYSTAASTYFFPLPSNIEGTWYFELTIVSNTSGTANLTLESPIACTTTDRKGCTNAISTLVDSSTSNLLSFTAGNGKLGYAVYSGNEAGWRIGVSTAQGPSFNIRLRTYIAYGYVPFVAASGEVIADYTLGCTLPAIQCLQVSTIELPKPSTASRPYFIAVDYRNGTNSARTLVWVSTPKYPCPTCNHGSCPTPAPADYANYGKCKCNYGYAGTDCSISAADFQIQIIVVIIIGVLLLVTACIGLIAWFISKRRASQTTGYERV